MLFYKVSNDIKSTRFFVLVVVDLEFEGFFEEVVIRRFLLDLEVFLGDFLFIIIFVIIRFYLLSIADISIIIIGFYFSSFLIFLACLLFCLAKNHQERALTKEIL